MNNSELPDCSLSSLKVIKSSEAHGFKKSDTFFHRSQEQAEMFQIAGVTFEWDTKDGLSFLNTASLK